MEEIDNYSERAPLILGNRQKDRKLSFLPLVFIIFFEVSGGAYGAEPTVAAGGPLLAILGFLIFPFLWSIPEALVTAELASAFPANGGFVIWVSNAFGPFVGSLCGFWKFFSGAMNLASLPLLCVDYFKVVLPAIGSGWPRQISLVSLSFSLSLLNYLGLVIVGYTAVTLGVISLLPFVFLILFSLNKIEPRRWLSMGQTGVPKNWTLYFNTLFWNLNFWDNASALAGEVMNPQTTFPRALLAAVLLTCAAYLLPLIAAIGAVPLDQKAWVNGYFADVSSAVAGGWLKYLTEIAAGISVMGLYEAQLSACAYQLLGMAEMGMLPRSVGEVSRWFDTPWVGIVLTTVVAIAGSTIGVFVEVISSANFLYALGMLAEFAAFLRLRKTMAATDRPFTVPLGTAGLVAMCAVPSLFLVYMMFTATALVFALSAGLTVAAIIWFFVAKFCRSRKLIFFY